MPLLTLTELNSFNEDQEPKLNFMKLKSLGGTTALEKSLDTSYQHGLSGPSSVYESRRESYGRNEFPEVESQTWIEMFIESFEDPTLIVLIVSAVVSLAVGIYEDPQKGWIEGGAILVAVLIVAVVTSTNNFNKESQFRKLNAQKDDIDVGVIRDGRSIEINVKELVVGDIVRLNAGDKIPADGILVLGNDITCNESAITGESDDLKKNSHDGDVFLLSGATISSGYGHMLVTAVGVNSRWGRSKAKLVAESAETPLQQKLNVLAEQIGYFGMGAAVATFTALVALWFIYPESRASDITLFKYVLKAFIMGVTIVVVAVPEGLPLAVTLSLAYSTQKMMNDHNLIRVLAACETMGNATTICSDKTGTLTQNRMTVVEEWIGGEHYKKQLTDSKAFSSTFVNHLAVNISANSTAVLIKPVTGTLTVSGSNTEGALLLMLLTQLNKDYEKIRADSFDASRGDRMFTFSSTRKCMSVLILNADGKSGNIYIKGAAEVLINRCTSYSTSSGDEAPLTVAIKQKVLKAVHDMATNALRTVVLAHRSITNVTGSETVEEIEQAGFTLDLLVGIKDPLRPDVIEAVKTCQQAGIFVRMVTGDNIDTAKAIAAECGIYTTGGLAMEGPEFRKLTPAQLDAILPTLQVLARSSPTDKHTLVCRLNGHRLPESKEEWETLHPGENWEEKKNLLLPGYAEEWRASRAEKGGEVVGVTGDGTNDGPALKAADVGLSMGLSGTDVAKDASDIVIMDDNFSSIVKAVMWGRAVFDNIRKFLQFQLTVNAVALTLTFLSAVTAHPPPLNAVMMLWVNMIMDTMGALALGTEPPSLALLDRKPYRRNASLISRIMIRNIVVQFLFQMVLLAYLLLLGHLDFGTERDSIVHQTIIFNCFVFCQIFNEINARSISDECDVFHGLVQNPLFIGIIVFTSVAQFGLVEFGGEFIRTSGLTLDQWIKCILLGSMSLPLGGLMRLIPIKDSPEDFAEVSPLITTALMKNKSEKNNELAVSKHEVGRNITFYIWFFTVSILPALTLFKFQDHMLAHFGGLIHYVLTRQST